MKKQIIVVLMIFSLLSTFSPIAMGVGVTGTNIVKYAKITSDIPTLKESESLLQLYDDNLKTSLVCGSSKPLTLPYYIELDFQGYEAEITDFKIFSIFGKEMGVTSLTFQYFQKNKWVTDKSGVLVKWDKSDATSSEERTMHFDNKITSTKFRILINSANLKNNQFRIDELQAIGKLTRIEDKKNIKALIPTYTSVALGTQISANGTVKGVLQDGTQADFNVQYNTIDTSKTGIYNVNGTILLYSEKPILITDVYDAQRNTDILKDHWSRNMVSEFIKSGFMGEMDISPNYEVSYKDATLMWQRINKKPITLLENDTYNLDKADNCYYIYASAIANKAFEGIITNNVFNENQKLSRKDALGFIMNTSDVSSKPIVNTDALTYNDINSLTQKEKDNIKKAYSIGMISNSTAFRPNDFIKTGEFVSMYTKLLDIKVSDVTVIDKTFQDNQKALVNPNMGLFSYYLDNGVTGYDVHYNNDEYFEEIEGLSNVYIRVPWSVVEPQKDFYDFSIVDATIQKFKKVGKQVSLRFTASETGFVYATPKWVFDDGAKPFWWDNGNLVMPYYNDPIFLKHLDNFLGEVAKRYDGNPNIAYIDVGSLGLWGEGHTGNALYKLTPEEALAHMEIHKKHFKKTPVILLDDLGFGFNNRFTESIKGDIIKMGFGLRNDGYAGMENNMRFIRDEDVALADGIWQQAPIVMEPEHYGEMLRVGNWGDGMGLVKWIDKVHGTYLGLHGYVKQFYFDNLEFAHAANMRIGYRILPENVQLQSEIKAHDTFKMKINWKNVATAPCYKGAYPTLTLKDEKENIVSVMVDSNFNVKNLPVGEIGKATAVTQEAIFRANDVLPGGNYKAYLSLGALDGTPEIKMPIDAQNDGEDRYLLGNVTVKGDYSVKAVKTDDKGNIKLNFDFHGNPLYDYRAYWVNIALRESNTNQLYMPGDMFQSIGVTDEMKAAIKNNKQFQLPVKLDIQNEYKGIVLTDKSSLIGKQFDVYFVMDTLSSADAPGLYISDDGRDVILGTATIDNNLNIIFTPKQ